MEEKKESHHSEHHHGHGSAKKINNYRIFIALCVILGLMLIFSIYQTFSINSAMKDKAQEAAEAAKPAKIELAVIKNSQCTDCFDVSQLASYVKSAKVEVTSEKNYEFDSAEGKQIISKYDLEKVPTIVVTGEIDKADIEGFERKNDALIFTQIPPPYVNVSTGEIKGRISLTSISDPACVKCGNMSDLITQMKLSGISIAQQKEVSTNTEEGKQLVIKYNLEIVPTIILSKDAEAYPNINQIWKQVGTIEDDGSFVFRSVSPPSTPPYLNLTTGQIEGLVEITYLIDKSCTECYNVSIHKQILTQPQPFALKLDKELTIDLSEDIGKQLVAKYNITKAPTAILSSDVRVYPNAQLLKQFFSVEKDGSYVFRQPSVVGAYKDLETNQIVKPQQGQQ